MMASTIHEAGGRWAKIIAMQAIASFLHRKLCGRDAAQVLDLRTAARSLY